MRVGRPCGFTLVEILLAGVIFVVTLIPLIDAFVGAGRTLSATGEHSQALYLTEMVVKDLQTRREKNPLQFVRAVEASRLERTPVAATSLPWFSALEDDRPPHGRILAQVDSGLGPAFPVLDRYLSPYEISITPKGSDHPDLPGPDAALTEVEVRFHWTGRDRKLREFATRTLLPRPRPDHEIEPVEPWLSTEAREIIAGLFYPDEAGQRLEEIIAARGADPAMVEDLGMVVLLAVTAQVELGRVDLERTVLIQSRPRDADPVRQAEDHIELARLEEARAFLALQIARMQAPRLRRIGEGDFDGRLGSPPPPARFYASYLWRSAYLPRVFVGGLTRALGHFADAGSGAAGAAMSARRRLALQYRMLELLNLLTLSGIDTASDTTALLDRIEQENLGRNPYALEYTQTQREVAADPTSLRRAMPRWAEELTGVRTLSAAVDPVLTRVLDTARRTGADLELPEAWPPRPLRDATRLIRAIGLVAGESGTVPDLDEDRPSPPVPASDSGEPARTGVLRDTARGRGLLGPRGGGRGLGGRGGRR